MRIDKFPEVKEMLPLEQVLPHRPPMILIDEMVRVEGGTVECATTIRPTSTFVREGKVPAIVGLEYMAQSVGAVLGLWVLLAGGRVTGGLLLGTPELEVDVDEFDVGDRLRIICDHLWGNEDVWKFHCEIVRAGISVMRGTLNVLRIRPELEVAS